MEVTQKLLSTPEAAEFLNMSPFWLHKERAAGRGPRYLRLGKKVKYTPEFLREYLEQAVVDTEDSRG